MPAHLKSRLGQIARRSDGRVDEALDNAELAIEVGAQQRARVDTGEMRARLQGRTTGHHSRAVDGGADHTVFNEYGTEAMSAQPMLVPAAEDARDRFYADVRRAFT